MENLHNEVISFINYVCEFYEEGKGIYANDFNPPVSRAEIAATVAYTMRMSDFGHRPPFEFDSVDREMVRLQLETIREPRKI